MSDQKVALGSTREIVVRTRVIEEAEMAAVDLQQLLWSRHQVECETRDR